MKRISVDFDEELWGKLISIQAQESIKTQKKVSLSKIITDMVKIGLESKTKNPAE
ncbi:hypothetical protein [Runella limosa]|uniref:hypothetical protein n=1 Tax=Runella limosa TaxID=370978 RepID=UPI00042915F7|nr:hypothetical protein [Runella limosa]